MIDKKETLEGTDPERKNTKGNRRVTLKDFRMPNPRTGEGYEDDGKTTKGKGCC